MTKFHFRLATLLRLRETTRDECRVQLADAQRADAELQSQLARLDMEQTTIAARVPHGGRPGRGRPSPSVRSPAVRRHVAGPRGGLAASSARRWPSRSTAAARLARGRPRRANAGKAPREPVAGPSAGEDGRKASGSMKRPCRQHGSMVVAGATSHGSRTRHELADRGGTGAWPRSPCRRPPANCRAGREPCNGKSWTAARRKREPAARRLRTTRALELRIELGRTHVGRDEVEKLRTGSVVPLDNAAGDPVAIYAAGRLIARGEALVIDGKFGVRVVEVISASRRELTIARKRHHALDCTQSIALILLGTYPFGLSAQVVSDRSASDVARPTT